MNNICITEHKSKTSLNKALDEAEKEGCSQYSIVITEYKGKKTYIFSRPVKVEWMGSIDEIGMED